VEIVIGFLIALGIGLTGVGGGVITAPVLILFLHMPAAVAVGTALIFGVVVKTTAVPVYLWRKQVDFRALRYLLLGGVPGVIGGSILLQGLKSESGIVLAVVGFIVAISASLTLLRMALKLERSGERNRYVLLALAATVIGWEVGFSSAGAGALGTIALMQLTTLAAPDIVGTDLMFGFVVALIGGGFHFAQGSYDPQVLIRLITGGVVGGIAGAYMAGMFPKRVLRAAISVWLVWLGTQLCYRGWLAMARG
jgi:uncharacterized membrane protein YfcA